MRNSFFILAIVVLLPFGSQAQKIAWKEGLRLTWDDFKGVPDTASAYFALTQYSFSYTEHAGKDKRSVIDVSCAFDPIKSWKKKEHLSPELLLHEQLHFHAAEVYARKMRKAFEEYAKTHDRGVNTAADLNKIFQQLYKECTAYQSKYDKESDHSVNKEQQELWRARIMADLKELSAYEVK